MVLQKLYQLREFEDFIGLPENQARRFELINGEIVEKVPTREHGILAGNIVTDLNNYLRQNRIGRAAVEARHRPPGDNQNDRLPDVSFVSDATRPVEREGAALYLPDLAVEIKSPDDSFKKMRDKARYYLANGTRLVWLVFPEQKVVEVYTLDDEYVVGVEETLSGGDVLPGLMLPVSHIFDF